MDSVKRIIVNTSVQYAKAIVTTALALWTTRLILDTLNVSDFGLYSLIGGVVGMLSFVINALSITTQRYVSFFYGQRNMAEVSKVFANSLFLHALFSVVIALVTLLLKDWLIGDVLTIASNRVAAAHHVYVMAVVMLLLTIMTAPFKALLISRENIVFISCIEIADSILKVGLVIWLTLLSGDKLITYANMMTATFVFNIIVFGGYSLASYPESRNISISHITHDNVMHIAGFASWTTYGMGAITLRNQGTQIILNHFFSTVINAAFGIAMQVFNAISFITASILNAMNPQIMKAEGAGRRTDMLLLAAKESRMSAALLMLIAIPLIFEMPEILPLWLKEVPAHTVMFCRYILIAFIIDQTTLGLNSANQAVGHIRNYTLLIYTPKLLFLPLAYGILRLGFQPYHVMLLFVGIELLVAILRLPYMMHTINLSITNYVKTVIQPLLPLLAVLIVVSSACICLIDMPFRFVITVGAALMTAAPVMWRFTLTSGERRYALNIITTKLKRQ